MNEGQHEWVRNDPRWPSIKDITYCVRCCLCQRADGKNKPCSGTMPTITLRVDVSSSAPGSQGNEQH